MAEWPSGELGLFPSGPLYKLGERLNVKSERDREREREGTT